MVVQLSQYHSQQFSTDTSISSKVSSFGFGLGFFFKLFNVPDVTVVFPII